MSSQKSEETKTHDRQQDDCSHSHAVRFKKRPCPSDSIFQKGVCLLQMEAFHEQEE